MKKLIETRQANEPVVVDPVLQRNGLKQLEQAIELIPHCQKHAYLEAKKQCPLLIEKEPGLMRFLEYDKFDVWAAARRLVAYWTMRKDLFQERAFLPMHQTGNGTLSTIDLEVLSTGFTSILPAKDKHSDNFVYCFIPSRLDKDNDIIISRRRCSFYMFSVVMDMNPASKNTFSGLMMMNQVGYQRTMMVKPTVEMIKQLPIYSDYGIMAHCPMDVERKTFFEMVAPTVMKLFERDGGLKSSGILEAVSATSRQDLADKLVACDYNRESLPTECGGEWSVEKFRQWQVERRELERQHELEYFEVARRISSTCASVSMGDLEQKCESENFALTQRPTSPLATMEELDQRWEWENLARAPLPLSPAAAAASDELEQTLEWENPGVMAQTPSFPSAAMSGPEQNFEHKNLDDDVAKKSASTTCTNTMDDYNRRVAEAMKEDELLSSTSYEAERLERKRVLDREHSKRKRVRRKDHFATLQESHAECLAENARLKKASAFLKKLLRESKKVIKCHLSGNADGSVSIDRQSVIVASSTVNQRQTGNNDVSASIGNRQSVVAASSTVRNQRQTGNDDISVSIGNRQSVVAASSTANQLYHAEHDGSAPASLPASLPSPSMNRHADNAPFTAAGGASGMNESVYNQFLAARASTFPSWLVPFSWSDYLAQSQSVPGPDVTNNALLLNMTQQQQYNSFQQREAGPEKGLLLNMLQQQQQQQQQPNSFPQQEAGPDVTNNEILLNMMMQQQLLAQSQHQPLVYPPFNNALYYSNNHPSATTTRHQSATEEKNDDTPPPFR